MDTHIEEYCEANHKTLVDDDILEKVYRVGGTNDRLAARIHERYLKTSKLKWILVGFSIFLVIVVALSGVALHLVAESVQEVRVQDNHVVVAGTTKKVTQRPPSAMFTLSDSVSTQYEGRRRLGISHRRALADTIEDHTFTCTEQEHLGCISLLHGSCTGVNAVIDSLRTERHQIMIELCYDISCEVSFRGTWEFAGLTNNTVFGTPQAQIIMWNQQWNVQLVSPTGNCAISMVARQDVIDEVMEDTRRRLVGAYDVMDAHCPMPSWLGTIAKVSGMCASFACPLSFLGLAGVCFFCEVVEILIKIIHTAMCVIKTIG